MLRVLNLWLTWTPKVCKLIAFMAVILGYYFTYFWGLGIVKCLELGVGACGLKPYIYPEPQFRACRVSTFDLQTLTLHPRP